MAAALVARRGESVEVGENNNNYIIREDARVN